MPLSRIHLVKIAPGVSLPTDIVEQIFQQVPNTKQTAEPAAAASIAGTTKSPKKNKIILIYPQSLEEVAEELKKQGHDVAPMPISMADEDREALKLFELFGYADLRERTKIVILVSEWQAEHDIAYAPVPLTTVNEDGVEEKYQLFLGASCLQENQQSYATLNQLLFLERAIPRVNSRPRPLFGGDLVSYLLRRSVLDVNGIFETVALPFLLQFCQVAGMRILESHKGFISQQSGRCITAEAQQPIVIDNATFLAKYQQMLTTPMLNLMRRVLLSTSTATKSSTPFVATILQNDTAPSMQIDAAFQKSLLAFIRQTQSAPSLQRYARMTLCYLQMKEILFLHSENWKKAGEKTFMHFASLAVQKQSWRFKKETAMGEALLQGLQESGAEEIRAWFQIKYTDIAGQAHNVREFTESYDDFLQFLSSRKDFHDFSYANNDMAEQMAEIGMFKNAPEFDFTTLSDQDLKAINFSQLEDFVLKT